MGGYLDLAVGCCNTGTGCIGFIFFRSTFVGELNGVGVFFVGFFSGHPRGRWSRVFSYCFRVAQKPGELSG